VIIFTGIVDNCVRFSSEEHLEDVTVRVEGCYSPSDDYSDLAKKRTRHSLLDGSLYRADFKTLNPSRNYFVANCSFLGYPFLRLVFEKNEKDISQILIPVKNNTQWSLSNYYTNADLKIINTGDMNSFMEIFMKGAYGRADQIPNVNTIVDLGFNCGWFALFSADKAQKYIAVEPDERLNSIGLTVNKKNINKIRICNRVFHNTNNQDINFYLNNMQSSSGSNIWGAKRGRNKFGKMKPERKPTTKKTINLPEIMENYDIDYIDLLKADIEGAEQFLLEKPNLEIILNKVGVLLLELHNFVSTGGSANSIKMFEDNVEIKNRFDEDIIMDEKHHGADARMIRLTKKPELKILESIIL
jgi:FkbM family methyltransferase